MYKTGRHSFMEPVFKFGDSNWHYLLPGCLGLCCLCWDYRVSPDSLTMGFVDSTVVLEEPYQTSILPVDLTSKMELKQEILLNV